MNSLASLLEHSTSTAQLILDAEQYAQAVLLQGRAVPWHEATAYANHLGQTVALLKPQVAVIAMNKMMTEELVANTDLVASMGEKSRSGFALKTFMSDESFKATASALVETTVKSARVPIVVQLPSPLDMLYLTANAAKPDADNEFDDDDAENAAVYYADWLRAFTEAPIAGLIFDERNQPVADEAYQPIVNTAEHYRWCVGVRRENNIIFRDPQKTIPVLSKQYWHTGEGLDGLSGVIFTEIAEDAVPEQVLAYREACN